MGRAVFLFLLVAVLLLPHGAQAQQAGGDLLGAIGDGKPGLGPNKLDDPEGVAVRGNSYYFSDSDNNRIVKYVVVMN